MSEVDDTEYCIDDEIADLIADMAVIDESKAIAFLCGALIALVESEAENQGHDPKVKMELVCSNRTITIGEYREMLSASPKPDSTRGESC